MSKIKTKIYAYLFASTFLLSGGLEIFIDSSPAYAGKGKKGIIDERDEIQAVGQKRNPEETRDEDVEESSEKKQRIVSVAESSSSLFLEGFSPETGKSSTRENDFLSNDEFGGLLDEGEALEQKHKKRTLNQSELSPVAMAIESKPKEGSAHLVFTDNEAKMRKVAKLIKRENENEINFLMQEEPLVTVMNRELKSHSLLEQLGDDISLANDLAYAIGKHYMAAYYLRDQNLKADQREKLEAAHVRYNSKAKEVLLNLRTQGWKLALKNDKHLENVFDAQSIIKGKSGSIRRGFIDNQPGIVLFHKKTGTLLPIFHGSRGDDFLPVSYDWDANLDVELYPIKLDDNTSVLAHRGFAITAESLQDSLHNIILTALQQRMTVKRIVFTGHSHGAAISAQACLNAIRELGPKIKINGYQFKNSEHNLFSHYGLSEPAGIHEDDIDKVREFVGRHNFLSVGASHDPVMFLFRGQFWESLKLNSSLASRIGITEDPTSQNLKVLKRVLVQVKELMPSSKWMDILNIAVNTEKHLRFTHIGHLALEPFHNLMQRVVTSRSFNLTAILSAVHYGGVDGNFDPRIGNPRSLNLMLKHALTTPQTVQVYIEEMKEILNHGVQMVIEGAQAIHQTGVELKKIVDTLQPLQKVAFALGGLAICCEIAKEAYNRAHK